MKKSKAQTGFWTSVPNLFYGAALIVLILSACQKDIEIEKTITGTEESVPAVINLSYDVETLTIPTLENSDQATSQEKIRAMAFSEKTRIQMAAFDDGTTTWRMEKLKPVNDLSVQHETPPGNEKEVKVTLIDKSGMGSFYDDNNVLLFKHPVPVPSFKDVIADVKENPNMIFTAMGINTADNVKLMLANAKANGSIIQDLGNGLVSVRTIGGNVTVPAAREADNFTTVNIFNTTIGIMIGSTMYDEEENIVCQSFYSYAYNADEKLVPRAIYMQSWDKNPLTGKKEKVDTNIYFENVTATININ